MKQYTHAWLAFMAVKRLKEAKLKGSNRDISLDLSGWIMDYEDDIIQGAWYPDAVIKDMANSHVLKITPSRKKGANRFQTLPKSYLLHETTKKSKLRKKSFQIDDDDNLPDRCESLTHSIVDNAKMQLSEEIGSPVTPTNNHIALRFFMLSHYIADAHVPFHCDSRRFSSGANIHGRMEKKWDDMVRKHFEIDVEHKRFYYDKWGFPLRITSGAEYESSYLSRSEKELAKRPFQLTYGTKRDKTWDFMSAICQHSYLLSHEFIPTRYDHSSVPTKKWDSIGAISFDDLSVAVFADTIDSIARVWFRAWRKYIRWAKKNP
jgi:hypothetical protein